MSVVIIGVDPGESTGVAMLVDSVLLKAFQGSPADAMTLAELAITRYDNPEDEVTVACERFISQSSRGGRTHQPMAQRVIGGIEHMTRHHGCKLVLQMPSDAWAIASNEVLTKLGMVQTGQTVDKPDANDANMAVRHALLYLARSHATDFDALLRRHNIFTT